MKAKFELGDATGHDETVSALIWKTIKELNLGLHSLLVMQQAMMKQSVLFQEKQY